MSNIWPQRKQRGPFGAPGTPQRPINGDSDVVENHSHPETQLDPGSTGGGSSTFSLPDLRGHVDYESDAEFRCEQKSHIDQVAEISLKLTYGEMIELAEDIWKHCPEGGITKDNLPSVLHRWATARRKDGEPE